MNICKKHMFLFLSPLLKRQAGGLSEPVILEETREQKDQTCAKAGAAGEVSRRGREVEADAGAALLLQGGKPKIHGDLQAGSILPLREKGIMYCGFRLCPGLQQHCKLLSCW